MGEPRKRALTRDDLLMAWLDAQRYASAHVDLETFHTRRLAAMETAFLVDLRQGPRSLPEGLPVWLVESMPEHMRSGLAGGRNPAALQRLFLRATDWLLKSGSAFGGYLEAPPLVAALYQRHRDALDEAAEAVRRGHRALLLDLLELLWGLDAEKRVDRARVVAAGFDPDEREPEPEDYW